MVRSPGPTPIAHQVPPWDPDHMPQGAAAATWLWQPVIDPATMITFLRTWGVRETFVSVPWTGPDPTIVATATALRAAGFAVSCLGGDHGWAEKPDLAGTWVAQAVATGLFTGIHLDIEPWTQCGWRGREDELLGGIALAVEAAQQAAADQVSAGSGAYLPVDVDLPAWVAIDHPVAFGRIAHAADRLTILAYPDRADDILSFAAAGRRLSTAASRDYRIAVETRPAPEPHTTFADDGIHVLRRELTLLASALANDPDCRGIAVHDVTGWQDLAIRNQPGSRPGSPHPA